MLSGEDAKKIMTFMHTVMYPWKVNEDFVEKRIRMYDQQKSKSSLTLLPEKHCVMQHIRQANLQTYICKQC